MLTLEELRYLKINATVAREAYIQADRRLADVLDTKKAFEQKAFTLFNAYIAISLALLGVGGAMFKSGADASHVWPFVVVGLIFVVGASLFVIALLDKGYGSLASDPDMWLNKGTIDGDDSILALMLVYITFYHKERISKSVNENNMKARLIRNGIFVGASAPPILIALLLILS